MMRVYIVCYLTVQKIGNVLWFVINWEGECIDSKLIMALKQFI